MKSDLILIALLGAILPFAAKADNFGDWSVYQEASECWAVSAPTQSIAKRNGAEISKPRREALAFVTYRIGERNPELSFSGGYDFSNSPGEVWLIFKKKKYELLADGEWAWPMDDKSDTGIIKELMKGSSIVLVGTSPRGFQTEDTFSLAGADEAISKAAELCDGEIPKTSQSSVVPGDAADKPRTQKDSPEK